jgi:hypothetical protein
MNGYFQLSPAFARTDSYRLVFVHIKIILLSAFLQTLFIIHYQRPISRLPFVAALQVLVFKI